MSSRDRGGIWFAIAVAAFLAVVVYALVAALTGSDLVNARDDAPVFLFGAVALISLLGWWRARAGAAAAQEEAEKERGRLGLERNRRDVCRLLWRLWSPE